MATKEIFKQDLYNILGVKEEATEKEILKGYRKKALKCHPDKNPDNPKAAEEFHLLSKALEILTDAAARAAYNQSLKAKKAADERNKVLDSKRKKFKEDLEAREQATFEQTQKDTAVLAEKKLQAEIERLRKEGSRLLEQEQERLRQELRKSSQRSEPEGENQDDTDTVRIKLKWKAQKSDPTNGGYDNKTLSNILSCYGTISTLLISAKRNGSAIVEFDNSGVSSDIQDEKGLLENPFTITWLSGKPTDGNDEDLQRQTANLNCGSDAAAATCNFMSGNVNSFNSTPLFGAGYSQGSVPNSNSVGGNIFNSGGGGGASESEDRDFESLVLRKMRQAEERKKLIEQMMKEEADGD